MSEEGGGCDGRDRLARKEGGRRRASCDACRKKPTGRHSDRSNARREVCQASPGPSTRLGHLAERARGFRGVPPPRGACSRTPPKTRPPGAPARPRLPAQPGRPRPRPDPRARPPAPAKTRPTTLGPRTLQFSPRPSPTYPTRSARAPGSDRFLIPIRAGRGKARSDGLPACSGLSQAWAIDGSLWPCIVGGPMGGKRDGGWSPADPHSSTGLREGPSSWTFSRLERMRRGRSKVPGVWGAGRDT